jgi:regulator of cell morphogenesis and NO signaling
MYSVTYKEFKNIMLNTKQSVRELALEIPGATRIFEQMGIDYCCGGAASLENACASAGITTADVVRALGEANQHQTQAGELKDWQTAPLSRLINYILEKHHVFTRQELLRLDALIAKVWTAHGERHPELLRLQELFKNLDEDLVPHMMKEERVLFPYIMQMEIALKNHEPVLVPPFTTVRNPVRMMSLEHDNAGALLREMRCVSSDYTVPSDGCVSYQTLYQALKEFEEDLHQHIFLENNILFPRAVEMEASLRT